MSLSLLRNWMWNNNYNNLYNDFDPFFSSPFFSSPFTASPFHLSPSPAISSDLFFPHHHSSILTERNEWKEWKEKMPRTEIKESEKAITITAQLPEGMTADDVIVELHNNALTIRGETKFEKTHKTDRYHRVERSIGSFHRSFPLPARLTEDDVTARMLDRSVLEITLSKPPSLPSSSKQISISSPSSPSSSSPSLKASDDVITNACCECSPCQCNNPCQCAPSSDVATEANEANEVKDIRGETKEKEEIIIEETKEKKEEIIIEETKEKKEEIIIEETKEETREEIIIEETKEEEKEEKEETREEIIIEETKNEVAEEIKESD